MYPHHSPHIRALHDTGVRVAESGYPAYGQSHPPSPTRSRPNDMRGPMDWHRYWMDRMRRELAQRNHAPATQAIYLSALCAFLTGHRCAPSTLRPDAIGRYLLQCKDERGLNPASVHLVLAALIFFFEHVVKAPYCIAGIPRMQADQKPLNVVGRGSVKSLIEGTADAKHRLALTMAYGCGLRASELIRLKWTDLDIDRGVLNVRKSKGGKDRTILLPATLMDELKEYRKHHQPISYVFESTLAGKPMGKRALQEMFATAYEKTGLQARGESTFLRQPFDMRKLEAGKDLRFVQGLLGHGSMKMTERHSYVNAGDVGR